jgi:hypothetical protein
MNTINAKEELSKAVEPAMPPTSQNFDFDKWATQVRQQMLASLQKRGPNT